MMADLDSSVRILALRFRRPDSDVLIQTFRFKRFDSNVPNQASQIKPPEAGVKRDMSQSLEVTDDLMRISEFYKSLQVSRRTNCDCQNDIGRATIKQGHCP